MKKLSLYEDVEITVSDSADRFDEKREIISQLKDKLKLQSEVIEEMKAALDEIKVSAECFDNYRDIEHLAMKTLESVSKKLGVKNEIHTINSIRR